MRCYSICLLVLGLMMTTAGCGQQNKTVSNDPAENKNPGSEQSAGPSMTQEEADKKYEEVLALVKAGKAQEGFNMLNDILKQCPKCVNAWDLRANMYAQSAQPVSAIRDLTVVLSLKPEHTEAWNMRGFLLLTLNRYTEAIRDFDKAIELNPQFSKAFNNRGLAKIAMRDFGNSLNDFNLAIQHKPDYVDAYNNRGYALLEIGNYSKAIQNFTEAIKLDSKYANAYNNRGLVRIKTGEVEEAIKDFTQAIAILPYVEKHYQHRRDAYLSLGKQDLAKADEQFMIQIRELAVINDRLIKKPKQIDLLVDRGQHFIKMNDLAKAKQDFETVIKVNPNNKKGLLGMARVMFISRQYDQTAELCDKVLASEQDMSAYSLRGDAAFAKGDFDQAVRDYELSRRFDNQVAMAYQNRAAWHEKNGRIEQARMDLESAKLLDPTIKSTASNNSNPIR